MIKIQLSYCRVFMLSIRTKITENLFWSLDSVISRTLL